jgi:hypothetical protein
MVDEADDLYGLPDDAFTAARDALAKRLRGEKRREDADAVKALRRPSVAAAAINRAVREHGAEDLLAAGEALRQAHEALLSGDGDAKTVREATARERAAVRAFTQLAVGEGASPSTQERVQATLHAASIDDDVRELLVAGRLEREAEAGADPMAMLASSAKASRSGGSAATKADRPTAAKPDGSGRRSGRSASKSDRSAAGGSSGTAPKSGSTAATKSGRSDAQRRREKQAQRAQEAAEHALTAQAEAETAAERARSTLEEAEAAARKARAVVEDLEGHERAARRALKEAEAEAERRRTEARRAVKAAESRS